MLRVSDSVKSIAVLVSGTGTLLRSMIDNAQGRYRIDIVVADQICPAIQRAKNAGIRTAVVPMETNRNAWNEKLAATLASVKPDLVVSAGFMRILGKPFLEKYEGRTINAHPSLLPSFPGAHAVRDALEYGVKVTGCTVHYVDSGLDSGEIIAQRAVEVLPDDTTSTLHERIKKVEREQIVELLHNAQVVNGKVLFS
ncbi:phosphoribosylglycinamide formyltransferase [Corynebacterium coyleae]|uniref:Phosphoribosylglycinamide formyltransferase n=2 Tax=Corynebacterium coyleae TaxID=53374 RepID=A0AAP7CCJ8_9CORY|nr:MULTISPECIES: phosphoribosylglycinamide formyltransferase [Corynebacterium]MDK6493947.1 phosphoribosylglycinamide formyltransferase [Corynebacterium coyleae]MDK8242680.1 phosphoribosylglycinamide formyltransferase [Corynebacterium coyleae]MDK8663628.1 phosphoribosylglycinamide formyltransferase [Corynebacterium coyleae]MDK8706536.1 phosphoribosylglycinamide formyltransferase [Corynebacterium coyleae]MDK8733430.1 phosphoribosylglycinamide formyltransferase [Corynebacterium coyleae]